MTSDLVTHVDANNNTDLQQCAIVCSDPETVSDYDGFELTESGNADRFERLYKGQFAYNVQRKKWMCWDGCRWQSEDDSLLWRALNLMSKTMNPSNGDDKARNSWVRKSQTLKNQQATAGIAKSSTSFATRDEKFDSKPTLFNVMNGTIDLETCVFRKHDHKDMLTQVAPVSFDPDAKCPMWDKYLNRVMDGNVEVIALLRRLAGNALCGRITHHILPFLHGGGDNGKSVFVETLAALMGEDYHAAVPNGLLMKKQTPTHTTDVAGMFGKRLAISNEVHEDDAFDEEMIKRLTSGDKISARLLHENNKTREQTAKIFLSGNHYPTIKGTDNGIRRRMLVITFGVTITKDEKDPLLAKKLAASELPGILNWALEGWKDLQANGVNAPECVQLVTKEYLDDEDSVMKFFEQCCEIHAGNFETHKDVREQYEAWCDETGRKKVGPRKIAARLKAHGVESCNHDYKINGEMKTRDSWKHMKIKDECKRRCVQPTYGSPWQDRDGDR